MNDCLFAPLLSFVGVDVAIGDRVESAALIWFILLYIQAGLLVSYPSKFIF